MIVRKARAAADSQKGIYHPATGTTVHIGECCTMVTAGSQGKLIAVLIGVIVLAGTSIGVIMLLQQPAVNPSVDIIKKDGTQLTVTLSQMQSMDSVEAYGAYEHSFGNPRGNGTYKGVKISSLIDLAGGMKSTALLSIQLLSVLMVKSWLPVVTAKSASGMWKEENS